MTDVTHCPSCGIAFKDFRSGDTFSSVSKEMYPGLPKAEWLKPYTRKNVLNELKLLKIDAWAKHLAACLDFIQPQQVPGTSHERDQARPPHGWICEHCNRTADQSPHTMCLAFCDECMETKP